MYEHELGSVRVGQPVVITAPSLPGRRFVARVAATDPVLDPATRTARVRALVSTPQGDLRPESCRRRHRVPLGELLAVPEDAVLDTATQRIVFVVRGEGEFEPRAVELGRDAQGFVDVLSGLSPGDEVVVAANFLIDSESRFLAALRSFDAAPMMGGLATSFLLGLLVYPVLYAIWKWRVIMRSGAVAPSRAGALRGTEAMA